MAFRLSMFPMGDKKGSYHMIQYIRAVNVKIGLLTSVIALQPTLATTGSMKLAQQSQKVNVMSAEKQCKGNGYDQSVCMIELIFQDLKSTGDAIGSFDISQIKRVSSTSYSISLPREELSQTYTYEFLVKGDRIKMLGKTESIKSY